MLTPINYAGYDQDGYVKIRVRAKTNFHLANVDLEMESDESVAPLVNELGDKVGAMWVDGEVGDGKFVCLEVKYYPSFKADIYHSYDDKKDLVGGTDTLISAFCDLIENLTPPSRRIWDNCHRKEFDIGFECGNTQMSFRTAIRPEIINRCAALGAGIVITVYPHFNYTLRQKEDLGKR